MLSEEDPQPWSERQRWTILAGGSARRHQKNLSAATVNLRVNIALICDGVPVMGVVYAPGTDVLYLAEGKHARRERGGQRMAVRWRIQRSPMGGDQPFTSGCGTGGLFGATGAT